MHAHSRTIAILTAAFVVLTLLPLSGAVSVPRPVQVLADVEGCTRADASGTVDVIAPPGAATLSWVSQCVIIPNGGSVRWTQRDAIAHGVVTEVAGCIDLPNMNAVNLPTTSVTLDLVDVFDQDEQPVGVVLQGSESDNGVGVCAVEADATQVEIRYRCRIHGAAMPGRIIVEL